MASGVSHISAYSAASSAMYQSTIDGSGIPRETFGDRMRQTTDWIFNAEHGTVMGRKPMDWMFLAIAIFVFIIALMGMTVVFCGLLYWVIDWNYPTLQGPNTILQNPGMSFRPQPRVDSSLIRFVKGDGSTYVQYLDHIEAYVQYYENQLQVGDNYIDCNEIRTRRTENLNKVCVFEINQLGGNCVKQQNYGFDDGQPCILLKLNRIFNWNPEEYSNETVPGIVEDLWKQDPWWIYVKCFGDDPATRDNMGPLTIHPPGFHFKYFPFRNQQGYRSPLLFVRFEQPHPGILLMVTCKAYAKNIQNSKIEMAGQVHFEVQVD